VIKRGTAHPFLGNDYIRPSAQALGPPVDLIGVHMPSVVAAALSSLERSTSQRPSVAGTLSAGYARMRWGLARGALDWAGTELHIFEIDFISF
jgi:hypothetical protein